MLPTMAAVAFDRLLDPAAGGGRSGSKLAAAAAPPPARQLYYISPALYATPDTIPMPEYTSPTSVSPSPYVFNRKGLRRQPFDADRTAGDRLTVQGEANEVSDEPKEVDLVLYKEEEEEENDNGEKDEDFLDTADARSVISCCSVSSAGFAGQTTPLLANSEFFDASEEFFSDGSVSHSPSISKIRESELHALRLNLLEEIGKRKSSEQSLNLMQNRWQRIIQSLSQLSFSFPRDQLRQFESDDPAQVCQQIVYSRVINEDIERVFAQAETEAETERVIESKNHEISRLRDRLQYYEAVHREMSLRNQEIIEITRQRRQRRKRKQRILWGCIGLSVTIGGSLLALSYSKPSDSSTESQS